MLSNEQISSRGTFSGSGMFSEVYVMPDNKAAKVCKHAGSDAWLIFAAFVATRSDDYRFKNLLPNIHGIRIDVENNTYTAMLDRLHEPVEGYEDRCDIWYGAQDIYADQFEGSFLCHTLFKDINDWVLSFDEVTASLYNDLSTCGNWMLDDDEDVVVTDPLVFEGWRELQQFNCTTACDFIKYLVKREPAVAKLVEFVEPNSGSEKWTRDGKLVVDTPEARCLFHGDTGGKMRRRAYCRNFMQLRGADHGRRGRPV